MDAFLSTFRGCWDFWGGRVEDVLRSSLLSLHDFNSHLDTLPEDMMTVLDLPELLQGEARIGTGGSPGLCSGHSRNMSWPGSRTRR